MPVAATIMRTRIAPTPSGFLHLGNACSFLLTARLATRYQGRLLLRIDDLDPERLRPEYLDDIFSTLAFLGIRYQEGPADRSSFLQQYSQHLRLSLYENLLAQLVATGRVYACTCSRKQLSLASCGCPCRRQTIPLQTPGVAWRVVVPEDTVICVPDERTGAQQVELYEAMPDFVVRRKDGLPAYQVASLADDLQYGINYIVRGVDLLYSTAAQLYLAACTGHTAFLETRFYHHPLLQDGAGSKLSKSAGATAVSRLREEGLTVAALEKMIRNW